MALMLFLREFRRAGLGMFYQYITFPLRIP